MPRSGSKLPDHAGRTRWALPVGIWLISFTLVGALAIGWITLSSALPTFHLFFSDFAHMKVWLATVVIVLAGGQLLWAARMFELVRFAPGGRFYSIVHRSAGWIILLVTLPIAYHCIILVGLRPLDTRLLVHIALGAFFYGMFVTKVFLVRSPGTPGWLLAVAGGMVLAVLLGLWLTSVPWFISTYGLSV
jgi:hypothetical protein